MATGTNTVVLFLRRRNNYECTNLEKCVDKFFSNHTDVTINSIETPVAKYVNYVWEGLGYDDYLTLLDQKPNDNVKNHDLFKEYSNKIKSDKDFWNKIIELEKEKIYYFILCFSQKLVIVKTGDKDAEKQFLGYEFSNRRGAEGIHAIERNKSIDECTKLFDINTFDNPKKASTYIHKAFENDFDFAIDETLKDNISRINLLDMMIFDRVDFEKNINLGSKKKVKIESKWNISSIKHLANIEYGTRIVKKNSAGKKYPVYGGGGETFRTNSYNRSSCYVISRFGMSPNCVRYIQGDFFLNDSGLTIKSIDKKIVLQEYLDNYLFLNQDYVYDCGRGVAQKNIDMEAFCSLPIPLPPLGIQQKIVDEISKEQAQVDLKNETINNFKSEINKIINECFNKYQNLLISDISTSVEYGTSSKSLREGSVPVIRMGNIQDGKVILDDLVYTNDENEITKYMLKFNDVLFNRTNSPELVGKVGIYQYNLPAIFAGYLIRINYIKDRILPLYLTHILNSDKVRNYGFSIMSKSVHQANINGTLLKNYEIPVPPIKEQEKIVAQIEELEKQIAEAQRIIDNSKQQKQAILDKYLK